MKYGRSGIINRTFTECEYSFRASNNKQTVNTREQNLLNHKDVAMHDLMDCGYGRMIVRVSNIAKLIFKTNAFNSLGMRAKKRNKFPANTRNTKYHSIGFELEVSSFQFDTRNAAFLLRLTSGSVCAVHIENRWPNGLIKPNTICFCFLLIYFYSVA